MVIDHIGSGDAARLGDDGILAYWRGALDVAGDGRFAVDRCSRDGESEAAVGVAIESLVVLNSDDGRPRQFLELIGTPEGVVLIGIEHLLRDKEGGALAQACRAGGLNEAGGILAQEGDVAQLGTAGEGAVVDDLDGSREVERHESRSAEGAVGNLRDAREVAELVEALEAALVLEHRAQFLDGGRFLVADFVVVVEVPVVEAQLLGFLAGEEDEVQFLAESCQGVVHLVGRGGEVIQHRLLLRGIEGLGIGQCDELGELCDVVVELLRSHHIGQRDECPLAVALIAFVGDVPIGSPGDIVDCLGLMVSLYAEVFLRHVVCSNGLWHLQGEDVLQSLHLCELPPGVLVAQAAFCTVDEAGLDATAHLAVGLRAEEEVVLVRSIVAVEVIDTRCHASLTTDLVNVRFATYHSLSAIGFTAAEILACAHVVEVSVGVKGDGGVLGISASAHLHDVAELAPGLQGGIAFLAPDGHLQGDASQSQSCEGRQRHVDGLRLRIGHRQRAQSRASFEGACVDGHHVFRQGDGNQFLAILEGLLVERRQRCGQLYLLHATAALEGITGESGQVGEVLDDAEVLDLAQVSELIAEGGNHLRLRLAELAVAVEVPVFETDVH